MIVYVYQKMYKNCHRILIYNSSRSNNIQHSTGLWLIMVYSCNEILHRKGEEIIDTCNNMKYLRGIPLRKGLGITRIYPYNSIYIK